MKLCPLCGTTFTGPETFCSKDGARLFETDQAPGQWSAKTIGPGITLDALMFVDQMGERYEGTLPQTGERVKVTLLNMGNAPVENRQQAIKTAQALLDAPLPKEIAQIIAYDLDHEPAYIVEQLPQGQTLRNVLNEKEHLHWSQAVSIANHTMRALEWLSDQGVIHRNIHPHAIHLTDALKGHVTLTEWFHGVLFHQENPLEASSNGLFVPYAMYMAPEQAQDASAADVRSLIYSCGMLLHEAIVGTPPFVGQKAHDVLKKHTRERPPKLSISSVSQDVAPQLDDLFEVLVSRKPESRFQMPMAMINALSSVLAGLNASHFKVLERDGAHVDKLDVTVEANDSKKIQSDDKKTLLFIDVSEIEAAKAASEASEEEPGEDEAAAEPSPSVEAVSEVAPSADDAPAPPAQDRASVEAPDDSAPVDDASSSTERMDKSVLQDDKADKEAEPKEEPPATSGSGISGSSQTSDSTEETKPKRKKKRRKRKSASSSSAVSGTSTSKDNPRDKENISEAPAEVPSEDALSDEVSEEAKQPSEEKAPSQSEEQPEPRDEPVVAIDPTPTPLPEPDVSSEVAASAPSETDEGLDAWFSDSADDFQWEMSQEKEHAQRIERKYRRFMIGALVIFALVVTAAVIYFQFVAADRVDEEEQSIQQLLPVADFHRAV